MNAGEAREHLSEDRIEFGAGFGERGSRLEAADGEEVGHVFYGMAFFEDDGQVDVGAAPHKAFGHDADDGAHAIVKAQAAADDVRVARELALPEFVAEHGDGFGRGSAVAGYDVAANKRLHAHDFESVDGAEIAAEALRLADARPGDVANGGGEQVGEGRNAALDFEVALRCAWRESEVLAWNSSVKAVERFGMRIRKRVEDDAVDDAKEGGGSTDAECEREDSGGGEAGSFG